MWKDIFFENISIKEYNEYCARFPDVWVFRDELIRYTARDVIGLLEILTKLNNEIYSNFGLNINSYNTIASLALAIYLSNYYNPKFNLKIIKGQIENEIRSAYYGGITAVHESSIDTAYYYDLNSSYPASMLNPMPTGNPVYTTNTNLDEIFGFVEATVTAPSKDVLRVLTLPSKTPDGISYNRGTFRGMWFSEELKHAVSVGYKVEVEYAYIFDKTPDVFRQYVEVLYKAKANADNNPSVRITNKFLLNTLYGRMGMNNIEYKVKIMDTSKVSKIMEKYYWTNITEIGDKSLVRYGKLLDPTLLELLQRNEIPNTLLNAKNPGVISSVSSAAATAAYSRILLNKFTNIPGNPAIYTDTDSVILPYPLSDNEIGRGIGMLKL
jgi:hypothetical protein